MTKLMAKTFCNPVAGQTLQKEHVICLHLISKETQVLVGKFTIIRQPSLSGFDINTISKANDVLNQHKKCFKPGFLYSKVYAKSIQS